MENAYTYTSTIMYYTRNISRFQEKYGVCSTKTGKTLFNFYPSGTNMIVVYTILLKSKDRQWNI